MNRRSRSGQSIIIIAFAFIALIAFVGIATDVAMLFVRFGALRRAVDAASIAAAGQVRENADYFTMQSIAEQFIKVHGIDPTTVKVETCETEISDYAVAHGETPDQARSALIKGKDPVSLVTFPKSDLCKDTPQKLVRVSAQIQSPTSFLSLIGWKAVTLSTSSVSQTASLDVALLLDTSLSETQDTNAHMNDTSYYKFGTPNAAGATYFDLNDYPASPGTNNFAKGDIGKSYLGAVGSCTNGASTTAPYNAVPFKQTCNNADALRFFREFTNPSPNTTALANTWITNSLYTNKNLNGYMGLGLGPAPASYLTPPPTTDTAAFTLADHDANGAKVIRYECWYSPKFSGTVTNEANYAWAGCCNDPSIQSDNAAGTTTFNPALKTGFNPDPNWYVYDDGKLPESIIMTTGTFDGNSTATVVAGGRQWNTAGAPGPYTPANGTAGQYNNAGGVNAYAGGQVYPFNRGDGNYSDLICRPFKDVRDAARRFLKQLDFVRGDRVVLVTFDSTAKAIVPYGSNLAIINDQNTAIRALNMQVGVEVNPVHLGSACTQSNGLLRGLDWMGNTATADFNSYYGGTNPQGLYTYWTRAQCDDTNTGAGIMLGSNSLVDPRWIRRDSVWVMVVLSDGYPNRTPSIGDPSFNIGPNSQANSTWTGAKPADPKSPTDPMVASNCDTTSPTFGTEPQACAAAPSGALPPGSTISMGWGLRNNDPLDPFYTTLKDYPGGSPTSQAVQSYWSFGFCPAWTFNVQKVGNITDDSAPTYWPYATAPTATGNPLPWCADNDPNSRHFCMTPKGDIINPDPAPLVGSPDEYRCDPNYDAMDYAMDMTDFAALKDYTAQSKGNFIAMYSIYFAHSNASPDNLALGVKMGRYIADAGDNGDIDNPLQRWYRDQRDVSVKAPLGPPAGGSCPNGGSCNDTAHNPLGGTWMQGHPPDDDAFWQGPLYGYKTADACIDLDNYSVKNPAADATVHLIPAGNAAYSSNLTQSCGQFFYAANITSVNSAFTEIAGRLFTRLSR
jgi:Flp pilus assembly protein TadG